MTVAEAAHVALTLGLTPLPVRSDGSKAPDVRTWTQYQTTPPTPTDLDHWFTPTRSGLGLVCGNVSGGLEMVELEGRALTEGVLDALLDLAEHERLDGLIERIMCGYQETTPSGGIHWLYRSPGAVTGNQKLASRSATTAELEANPGDRVKVLIETRGEGGFVVIAPSNGTTHPTGRSWQLDMGGLHSIAVITADERARLHRLCRLLDRTPTPDPPTRPAARAPLDGERPGDAYTAATTWNEVLEPHGWVHVFTRGDVGHWRRPGKTKGISATVNANGTDRLVVHSTSTPFQPSPSSYDRYGAYAVLNHGGDHTAAARALRHDGYGGVPEQPAAVPRPTPAPGDTGGSGDPVPAPAIQADGKPMVIVNMRPLDVIVDDILQHLETRNDPPVLYVRSGAITRVRLDEKQRPIVELVGQAEIRSRIAAVCRPVKTSAKDNVYDTVTPLEVGAAVLTEPDPPFPPLEAVVETPTVRPDGTVHQAAGYDPQSRLLHIPKPGLVIPPVPHTPAEADIEGALLVLEELIHDFPFDTQADRANALALLLTPIVRSAIDGQVPLALITSPEPGTGKGLLANVTATVHTGRPAAARPIAAEDDEIRKTILSILLEGPTLVVLDNVEDVIRSPALAALLTTDTWSDRVLGSSKQLSVPNRATWVATGNNITVGGDLARRCYQITLNAHQARPWARTGFQHPDLLTWTQEQRGRILAALLTLARAWWAAGQPDADDGRTIGGFTPWARCVGGILHHAGVTGFLGNLDAFHEQADVETEQWEAFLAALQMVFHGEAWTCTDVTRDVTDPIHSVLRPYVPAGLADHMDRAGFPKRLGQALRRRVGRRHGDEELAVEAAGKNRSKVQQWTVVAYHDHTALPATNAPCVQPDTTTAGTAGTHTGSDDAF